MRAFRGVVAALLVLLGSCLIALAATAQVSSSRALDAGAFSRDVVGALRSPTGIDAVTTLVDTRLRTALASNGLTPPVGFYEAERRGVTVALAESRVASGLERSLQAIHRAILDGETPGDLLVDLGPLRTPALAAVAEQAPQLAPYLEQAPAFPSVSVGKGPSVEAAARAVRTLHRVRDLPPVAAGVGAAALLLAVLIAADRRRVLRRIAWALGLAAAAVVALGYGAPAVGRQIAGDSAGAIAAELLTRLLSSWPTVVVPLGAAVVVITVGLAFTRRPARR